MSSTLKLVSNLVKGWTTPPNVLIVDDDEFYVESFKRVLVKCGCKVFVAFDGKQAINIIREHSNKNNHFHIVFLDLVIPVQDGTEILAELRQTMPEVPVVIVTGYAQEGMMHESLKHGYLGVVEKPLDLKLIEKIFSTHNIFFRRPEENHKTNE